MKTKIIMIFLIIFFNSCSSINGINPSQNRSLSQITDVKKEKKEGTMQKALDNWLKKEWTPSVEKDKKIKRENQDKTRSFSFQEYIDKAVIYSKESNTESKDSHSQMIKSLPVIGY